MHFFLCTGHETMAPSCLKLSYLDVIVVIDLSLVVMYKVSPIPLSAFQCRVIEMAQKVAFVWDRKSLHFTPLIFLFSRIWKIYRPY